MSDIKNWSKSSMMSNLIKYMSDVEKLINIDSDIENSLKSILMSKLIKIEFGIKINQNQVWCQN